MTILDIVAVAFLALVIGLLAWSFEALCDRAEEDLDAHRRACMDSYRETIATKAARRAIQDRN